MASLKPKLFCGVAFRMKGGLTLQSAHEREQMAVEPVATHAIYATILVKRLSKITAGQRLHTDRTNRTLHCSLQTVSPKRQTIRVKALTVKLGWANCRERKTNLRERFSWASTERFIAGKAISKRFQ